MGSARAWGRIRPRGRRKVRRQGSTTDQSKHTGPWLDTRGRLDLPRNGGRLRAEFVRGRACDVSEDVQREYAPESVSDGRRGVGGVLVEVDDRAR